MEVFSQYAVAASREAFDMAGLDMAKEDPYRVGVIIGSGIGGLASMEKEHEKIITKGPKRVSPNADSFNDIEYGSGKCSN